MRIRPAALALTAVCALVGAGCGADESGPDTSVVVTRDFGAQVVAQREQVPLSAGLTVMRQLQKVHETETSYGGRYVDSIGGVKEDGDSSWLMYVDGVETDLGATSIRLKAGQNVQWDFHAWQTIRTGGAIVGAYPEPLKSRGARVICAPRRSAACARTRAALKIAGVPTGGADPVRVVVGPWQDIQGFDGVPDLTTSGETNGAFAEFSSDGSKLTPYSADGSSGKPLKRSAGLLAAFSEGRSLSWVVTGTDAAGVEEASALLDRPKKLQLRFGFAVSRKGATALPEGAG